MPLDNFATESPHHFAKRLDLPVEDYFVLTRALTHRSYLNENKDAIEDNERLEFLGDAVLDFIVAEWLYHHFPEKPEGDLTRLRAALVHTDQLASFAQEIDLGHALRLGRGEIQAGGRKRPTLLCDAFEALVGAIYLDKGIEAVNEFMCLYWRMWLRLFFGIIWMKTRRVVFRSGLRVKGILLPGISWFPRRGPIMQKFSPWKCGLVTPPMVRAPEPASRLPKRLLPGRRSLSLGYWRTFSP